MLICRCRCLSASCTHVVQLVVKATGVAHRLPIGVSAPKCCGGGFAVGTADTRPFAGRLKETKVVGLHILAKETERDGKKND